MQVRVRNRLRSHGLPRGVQAIAMVRTSTHVKGKQSHQTKNTVPFLAIVFAVTVALTMPLLAPTIVEADSGIRLLRDPNPPCYLLNDGATPQAFWWKITFDAAPSHALLEIVGPDDTVMHTQRFDLSGLTSPVYNPENTVGDAGMGDPAYAYSWRFDGGIGPGLYRVRLVFYGEELGHAYDAGASFRIMQRLEVYTYDAASGDPLEGWEFLITGPEDFSGITDGTGYAVFQSRSPDPPCHEAGQSYRDVLEAGTYTVVGIPEDGSMSTDPEEVPPYQKTFTVPHPAGETIRIEFGSRNSGETPPDPPPDQTPDMPNDSPGAGMRTVAFVMLWIAFTAAVIAGAVVLVRRRGTKA